MVYSLDFDGVPVPKDFFDILDFPLEDVDLGTDKDDWNDIQLLDLPSDIPVGFSSGFVSGTQNDYSKPIVNHSPSYEKTCRLKPLPSAAETTSSGNSLLSHDSSDVKHVRLFKTSSPVSILESTCSSLAENPRPVDRNITRPVDQNFIFPVKRARSKRSRPSNFDRLCSLPFLSASSSPTESLHHESNSGTLLPGKICKPVVKRTVRKGKTIFHISDVETRNLNYQEQSKTKKCTHCEVTSTPQWREGPLGPKTLCNACGVRYRSGRLFPEYRPAASPTFIPSLHSNSHKKVIEMRSKGDQSANNSRAGVEIYCRSQSGNSVRQLIV